VPILVTASGCLLLFLFPNPVFRLLGQLVAP